MLVRVPFGLLLLFTLSCAAIPWAAAGVKSEARSEVSTGGAEGAALQIDPRGEAGVANHFAAFDVAYSPELYLGVGDEGAGILNRGGVSARGRPNQYWYFGASASGSYGYADVNPITQMLSGTPTTVTPTVQPTPTTTAPTVPLEPIPATTTLQVFGAAAQASAAYQVNRRLRVDIDGNAQVNGGTNYVSRVQLPIERVEQGEGSVAYDVDRTETARLRFSEEYEALSPDAGAVPDAIGANATITEVTGEWGQAFDRQSDLHVEGGGAWVQSVKPMSPLKKELEPVVGASFETRSTTTERQEGRPKALMLNVRLAPYFDRLNGSVYPWVQGGASAGVLLTGTLSAEARLSLGGPWFKPRDPNSLALAEVRFDYRFTPVARVGCGARTLVSAGGAEFLLFLSGEWGIRTGPPPSGSP